MTIINAIKSRLAALFSSFGAMVGACGSICGSTCLGTCVTGPCGGLALPLLGFFGLSSSALNFLEGLKPLFLLITIMSLAYAFYKAYKPEQTASTDVPCGASISCCGTEKETFIQSKSFLWAITVLCAVMWLYPLIDEPDRGSKSNCNVPCKSEVRAINNSCNGGCSDGQK